MMTLTERLNRWRFQQAVKAMRNTPPLRRGDRDLVCLSMVQHSDVLAYLLAIKTFARLTRPARVVVVADPTLDDGDRRLIRQHVPIAEFVEAARFRRGPLPEGGCWERLAAIAALSGEAYVVQLDADTVTFDVPTEVIDAVAANRTFVIRSTGGVEIVGLETAAEAGRRMIARTGHIQAAAEARLTELPDAGRLRYVRGCAGFTGFGRGALTAERLDALSAGMREIHGDRWDEWGTEQVASNLLAASAPGAFMLPHPRYCNADTLADTTVLAHYIGYTRYTSRDYEARARHAAHALAMADG